MGPLVNVISARSHHVWVTVAAQKVNHILGCTKSTVSSRSREGIHPLDSTHETPHRVLHPALESFA